MKSARPVARARARTSARCIITARFSSPATCIGLHKNHRNRTVDHALGTVDRLRPDRDRAPKHRRRILRQSDVNASQPRSTNPRRIRRYFQRATINRGTYSRERASERASLRVAAARNGLNRERKEIGGDEGCARDPVIQANRRFPARAAIAFSPRSTTSARIERESTRDFNNCLAFSQER